MTTDPAGRVGFPGGFTVLMAVYGRDDPALFDRAVESVWANTLRPDAFILVVDGPTPPALEEVIRRAATVPGVELVRLRSNVGLAAALNEGLARVKTEWVLRADADDFNLPDRFERQARALADAGEPVDLLGGVILEVDRDGAPLACRDVPLQHDAIRRRLQTRNPFNHMTVAFRTATVIRAGGYPRIHLKEDWALWATAIAQGARCRNLPEVLVRATAGREMYRRRGGVGYLRSEWELQKHLYRNGHKTFPMMLLHCGARISVALMPSAIRGCIYEAFLRRRMSVAERSRMAGCRAGRDTHRNGSAAA